VPTYLVERYWPGVTIDQLIKAIDRGRRMMERMNGEGTSIHGISCILIPAEEVVFSLYQGPSEVAVRRLNDRAGIPISRIVEAIVLTEDQKIG
jgi:hypothetical protein